MPELYDNNNIFAKILRGEAPCVRVWEDETALAFMDIMPRGDGHTLVIPKYPARNILDLPTDVLSRFMPAVQKVAIAAMTGLQAEGVTIAQFSEPASGQVVFHLHFHVLPCWTGVALRAPGGPIVSPDLLAPIAARISAAM